MTVGGLNITEVTSKSISEAQGWMAAVAGSGPSRSANGAGGAASIASRDGGIAEAGGNGARPQYVDAAERLNEREKTIASQIIKEIEGRLRFLIDIGLDYLTLDRTAGTLSGGEAQRIRLATQIGSGLMGVLYVCDEPSVGLHPADDARLISTLSRLRDIGNTVLVVEHDEAIMRAADYIVDLGPGAGENGGRVVATGAIDGIIDTPESITGQYLGHSRVIPTPAERRPGNGRSIVVRGARANNLKDIDVDIPLGKLVCVTGVSGSGKSTLINEVLYKKLAQQFYRAKDRPGESDAIEGMKHIDKVVDIDQSPIGRTPRSNPATYTGTFTPIRELFATVPEARARGYKPGRFSFNVKGGRCEACSGDGHISIEMQFLPDVTVPCEVCKGARYNREALEIRFKGKNIAEVLDMTVTEALEHFANIPRIRNRLQTMYDVGLGYIRLGQPATHLSGGEAQRVKLSTELSKRATGSTLYILDEPTTGPVVRGLRVPAAGAAPAGRRGQQRHTDRAPPGPDQERRLDHRPGPGRRGCGRARDRGRDAGGDGGDGALAHGPVPGGAPLPRNNNTVGAHPRVRPGRAGRLPRRRGGCITRVSGRKYIVTIRPRRVTHAPSDGSAVASRVSIAGDPWEKRAPGANRRGDRLGQIRRTGGRDLLG